MSLEALLANMKPYDTRLHELRGFAGAVRSAAAIRRCLDGSDLVTGKVKVKVQDAYSMRSSPQVIGAAHDAVRWAKSQVETELNGVGDNPIFLPEENLTLTGANFQGSPVSLPMEGVGQAVTMVSVLSERRLNRLLNPALSVGLPAFLTPGAGMYSGMMLSQYTADTLIVEQRILSTPGLGRLDPRRGGPGGLRLHGHEHGDQERPDPRQRLRRAGDRVDGRRPGARPARRTASGRGVQAARDVIRKHVAYLDEDRPLYPDHTRMQELVQSCEILDAVEARWGRWPG